MKSGFYKMLINVTPALLLVIAIINVAGGLSLTFSQATPGGVLFKLSAALSSSLIPLVAAALLLRFDQWFAAWRMGESE